MAHSGSPTTPWPSTPPVNPTGCAQSTPLSFSTEAISRPHILRLPPDSRSILFIGGSSVLCLCHEFLVLLGFHQKMWAEPFLGHFVKNFIRFALQANIAPILCILGKKVFLLWKGSGFKIQVLDTHFNYII